MCRRVLMVALLLCAAVAFGISAKAGDMPQDVSIIQLIATPEKFDGKFVSLIGFLCIAFEGDSIYLHREDLEKGIPRNGLWVDTETLQRLVSERMKPSPMFATGIATPAPPRIKLDAVQYAPFRVT